ncbi:Undecaprenyldiphospho-muramoylpentapeptide beta-N-acetylglucosaminyltransferase [Elusimicrobium minutum Pei191]|uniref:UDP-N-acetylglucosamine--N-acetylmuramyl-(pentapeptide) pyrophosphoryl-undecaprenol N-acetylglucosamine transferase n=1 Tax=Elusimicrobium minutum (strain Pei191) TaxID=445932 RepID=MURG_ELUMP|nr:UDP-N-acetylglucosamine--N-acetylmuramyl-(pentapeptide) pyrophosphoryl-undecaprenol N-acetylglucosamine transferase [Elusimicrobium minutum]B2KE54.1 RecName: Full=UDP-N-acetylglucosamine--N-acetylmuramyl-(pentapeptide) pyrophosphoryl-undecaprenol N-acetylglucosamine transferase; AltName: Full=Undecaprenyl-PP-MurNAc-pentapeptide-UDPGlcNAc GlcNAc transferase [Elusimicrobium minutum Pei191]ACC98800.1 Undecaprenyldiphospho-muramoylpentapeptide beta-N-acetylglucosaminyltransferase [Elusimicrobium m
MRKFIIASGGTGGHFYPGFSLGKELRKRSYEVLFVVRKEDAAIKTLTKNNFNYKEINFTGFPRSANPIRHIIFCYKFIVSFWQTLGIINAFKPDVCVGMGGYLSFPVIVWAKIKGIKSAVHDSNTKIGLANKICAKFTNIFLLGLPTSDNIKNTKLVGTPIREEFGLDFNREEVLKSRGLNPNLATVLIFGGSQGSKKLNMAISKTAKKIVKKNDTVQFVHISGDKGYDKLRQEYRGCKNIRLFAYCHDIYFLMRAADFVVCRSGASTIAELYACRKPAVLIPFPYAADNHQYYNGMLLKKAGCAELFVEGDNLAPKLHEYIAGISKNKNILEFMERGYEMLELPDPLKSAEIIADTVESL